MKITQHYFLRGAVGALAGAGGVGLYTWPIDPHWIQFVRHVLPVANLPFEMEGNLLVQLSDLHVGPRVYFGYFIRRFRLVSDLKPHIVVFTGDFITFWSASVFDELSHVLDACPNGEYGTVSVLVNHDYGLGWSQLKIAAQVERRAAQDPVVRIAG